MSEEMRVSVKVNMTNWTCDYEGDSEGAKKLTDSIHRKRLQLQLTDLVAERAKYDAHIKEIEKILKENK